MTEAYDGRLVVGMDLHRRRSVLVRMRMDGQKLETVRVENSPAALREVLARAASGRCWCWRPVPLQYSPQVLWPAVGSMS
jgi:hypothetical protein